MGNHPSSNVFRAVGSSRREERMDSTESLVGAFEAEGYVTGVQVLDGAGADAIRRQFDALEAAEGRKKCQIGLLDRQFDQRFVWDLATHPVILDAVSAVLGPDVMLLATHFFCKYPEELPGSKGVPSASPGTPERQQAE